MGPLAAGGRSYDINDQRGISGELGCGPAGPFRVPNISGDDNPAPVYKAINLIYKVGVPNNRWNASWMKV